MDMPDDEAVGERVHGMTEKIPADGLDDVLCEFRTVGFDALPFFGGTDAFIGDGLTAEAVFSDPWLYVGETSAGGKADEEHTAFIPELYALYLCGDALRDGALYGTVDIPPEGDDVWVGVSPCGYEGWEFFFG